MKEASVSITAEEALTQAIIDSRTTLATGYPGSPAGGIITKLLNAKSFIGDVHWSVNEKVALEKAIGVAINGGRSVVCVKSVGLNAMLDPLTVVNLTPFDKGSLVIIVGDDPGGYGSQNDQDSRSLATFLNLPWLEPTSVQQAYDLFHMAAQLSETYGLPIFLRITRYMADLRDSIKLRKPMLPDINLVNKEITEPRYVPAPANAVAKTQELNEKMLQFRDILDELDINKFTSYEKSEGIIACGALGHKMSDFLSLTNLGQIADFLILASVFPLPLNKLKSFLVGKKRILVLEENTPYILNSCEVISTESNNPNIEWHSIANPGETTKIDIGLGINSFFGKALINVDNLLEAPSKTSGNCSESRYKEVLDLFDKVAEKENLTLKYYGDPGCLVSVYDRLEAKYAMGGSVSTVFGANIMAKDVNTINIAFIGDSGLFHSALNAILDAEWHKQNVAMVLLNNNSALTTGSQSHPGSNLRINYKMLFDSCGVKNYWKIDLDSTEEQLIATLQTFLNTQSIRVLEIVIPHPKS
jgi:indolepyruvate ferredoxin oxidoreductase alpha subunit